MKKTLILVLSMMMVMAFALSSCGGGGDVSESQYIGTWVASSVGIGDDSADITDDGSYTLTLNGDGTGSFVSVDADGLTEVSEVTWSETSSGFKTKGDTSLKFTDNGDGTVSAKIIGVELVFTRADESGEEVVDYVDGTAYGYAGDDPAEAACYEYMVETVAKDYDAAEYSIPVVNVIAVDYSPEDEILMYGDFWVYNYNANGDVLECVSGGNYPGVMHVSKDTYTVTAFDQVADGGDFDSSAQELFGDNYDAFMAAYSDGDNNDELRKIAVSDFVNLNGLDFNYLQDPGWDPVELYRN